MRASPESTCSGWKRMQCDDWLMTCWPLYRVSLLSSSSTSSLSELFCFLLELPFTCLGFSLLTVNGRKDSIICTAGKGKKAAITICDGKLPDGDVANIPSLPSKPWKIEKLRLHLYSWLHSLFSWGLFRSIIKGCGFPTSEPRKEAFGMGIWDSKCSGSTDFLKRAGFNWPSPRH